MRRFAFPICLVLLCPQVRASAQDTPVAAVAPADPTRVAAARRLYEEGVALSGRQEWRLAADRFRRAMRLSPLAVVAFDLGVALERLGRLVEASELFRRVLRDPTSDGSVRRASREALAAVLPRLIVRLPDGAPPVDVRLDAEPLDPALVGVAAPVDPGTHVLTIARHGERRAATQEVVVAEGEGGSVMLELPPTGTSADDGEGEGRGEGSTGPHRSGRSGGGVFSRWWFWTLVGVVAVGATTGAGLATTSEGPVDPFEGNFMPRRLEVR